MKTRKTTRIDMHLHTKGSDGWGTPEEIAAKAVERGLDGLVITDHHNTFSREGDRVAEACLEAGLLVFRGCEYSTDSGHALVYGVPIESLEYKKHYRPIQNLINDVRAAGGVVIPSHPYHGYSKKLGGRVYSLEGIPALEGRNGQCEVRYPHENEDAMLAAKALGIKSIGGSDAHDPKYIGCCFTEFKGWIDSEEKLVHALLHGRYRAMRNMNAVRGIRKSWKSWRKGGKKYSRKSFKDYQHGLPIYGRTSLDSSFDMSHVRKHDRAEERQDEFTEENFREWERQFYGESFDDPFYFSEDPYGSDPGEGSGSDSGDETIH